MNSWVLNHSVNQNVEQRVDWDEGYHASGRCSIDTSLSVLILDTTSDITKVSYQEMINNINNLSEYFYQDHT